jgi:hypothetical protein
MDILNARYKAVLSLCDLVKNYINDIGEHIDTRSYEKTLNLIIKTKYIDEIFYKFACIKSILKKLDYLIIELSNANIPGISDTRKLELITLYDKMRAKYNVAVNDTSNIDIDSITNLITKDINEDKINEYRAYYHENKECVDIYASMMQKIVDIQFNTNKSMVFKILAMIEDDKNLALKGTTITQFSEKLKKKNPRQNRYGLLPNTINMPLKDILKIISQEIGKIINGTDLKKIANKFDIGISIKTVIIRPHKNDTNEIAIYVIAKSI